MLLRRNCLDSSMQWSLTLSIFVSWCRCSSGVLRWHPVMLLRAALWTVWSFDHCVELRLDDQIGSAHCFVRWGQHFCVLTPSTACNCFKDSVPTLDLICNYWWVGCEGEEVVQSYTKDFRCLYCRNPFVVYVDIQFKVDFLGPRCKQSRCGLGFWQKQVAVSKKAV